MGQEALNLLPMINRELMALGITYEQKSGRTCMNPKSMPAKYNDYAGETINESNVYNVVRDIKQCEIEAGLLPCNLVTFHNVQSPIEYIKKLKKVVNHVAMRCNAEWANHMRQLVRRFESAIFCPDNNKDHNPAILNQIRVSHNDPRNIDYSYYYSTQGEMDNYEEEYYG